METLNASSRGLGEADNQEVSQAAGQEKRAAPGADSLGRDGKMKRKQTNPSGSDAMTKRLTEGRDEQRGWCLSGRFVQEEEERRIGCVRFFCFFLKLHVGFPQSPLYTHSVARSYRRIADIRARKTKFRLPLFTRGSIPRGLET